MADPAKTRLPSSFVRLGQPLPVDVYHESGILLLKKGHYVLTPEQRERLLAAGHGDSEAVAARLEREQQERAARRQQDSLAQPCNPLVEFEFLLHRTEGLLSHGLAVRGLGSALREVLASLLELSQRLPDGMLAASLLLDSRLPAAAHGLRVATTLAVLGRRLGLDAATLHSACGAALTMNIAIVGLLGKLRQQDEPLSEAQSAALLAHPVIGSAILREAGIDDELWHSLVQSHHEKPDGSGYPQALRGDEVPPLARLLALLDQLGEQVESGRLLPSQALATLFRDPASGHDPAQLAALVKELGVYPPGSFVELASGEIAVVTYRGDSANTPRVAALRRRDGPPYAEPLLRDTRQLAFRISRAVGRGSTGVKPAYLIRLWQRR